MKNISVREELELSLKIVTEFTDINENNTFYARPRFKRSESETPTQLVFSCFVSRNRRRLPTLQLFVWLICLLLLRQSAWLFYAVNQKTILRFVDFVLHFDNCCVTVFIYTHFIGF